MKFDADEYYRGIIAGMHIALVAASEAAHSEGQTLEGLTEGIDRVLGNAEEKYNETYNLG